MADMNNDLSQTGKWLIFHNDQLVILRDTVSTLPLTSELKGLSHHFIREHLLGEFNGSAIYCAEISTIVAIESPYDLLPLRKALNTLGEEWFSAAAKAFAILNWDRNHHFCGRCGQPTTQHATLYERHCAHCHVHFYPRISPSIIVLIQKGDELLMARSHHFNPGVYGLVAGFVEAGENVEDAVHREVYEETHIRVKNLRYFGSQPWPFPDSLMIGFFAEYESGELIIDPVEIEDAGWYHYKSLPGRPTSISIASKMLNSYLAEKNKIAE